MKDTEKAKELLGCENCQYRTIDCDSNGRCIYMNIIIDMAAWKEQQLIKKAAKWLKENAGMYWYDDIYIDCPTELLEDFKNAMKEE